jgi:hypothetical protein
MRCSLFHVSVVSGAWQLVRVSWKGSCPRHPEVHDFCCSKKLGYVPERDEALEVIRPGFQVSFVFISCICACLDADASSWWLSKILMTQEVVAVALSNVDQQLRASGFRLEHQNVLERCEEQRMAANMIACIDRP